MNQITENFLFDNILLVLNKSAPEIRNQTKSIVDLAKAERKIADIEPNDLFNLYLFLLEDITTNCYSIDNDNDMALLLAKYANNDLVRTDTNVRMTIENLFRVKLNATALETLEQKINLGFIWQESMKITNRCFSELLKIKDCPNLGTLDRKLQEVGAAASQLANVYKLKRMIDPNASERAVNNLNLKQKDAIKTVVSQFTKRKKELVFKTGLQGLNKMLGEAGGIRLGESLCFFARSFGYKSSFLMDFARWIVTLNDPPPSGKKTPVIWYVTLENEVEENLMFWFQTSYENIKQESAKGKSEEEIVEFVHKTYNERGWELIIDRCLGASFGFEEFAQRYEELEQSGKRIFVCIIDIAANMKKKPKAGLYEAVKEIMDSICNYTKNKKTTFITAQQLNRQGADLCKSGTVANPVKKLNENHIGDSIGIFQVPDTVIWGNIEKPPESKVSYMTFYLGKHRYARPVPESHMYSAYAFSEFGLVDDVNEPKSRSVANIYKLTDDSKLRSGDNLGFLD